MSIDIGAFLTIVSLAPRQDGLTLDQVLSDVPYDPASLFVYGLILISAYLVWRGSRGGRPRSPGGGLAGG